MGHSEQHIPSYNLMPTEGHSEDLGHVVPYKTYLTIFISLLFLTVITVAASRVNFGSWNIVIAMLIASVKAMLVALFFMHLKYEKPQTWIFAAFPLVLLAILMGGVLTDNPFRSHPVGPSNAVEAPNKTDGLHAQPPKGEEIPNAAQPPVH